jgi:hypothetical protein
LRGLSLPLRWVAVPLGAFLLLTAGLKVQGLLSSGTVGGSWITSPWVHLAAVEVEILLGLWWLSGRRLDLARWVTLAFFGILAAVSLVLALDGQASCNCFGRVHVNPWWTLGLDLGILLLLFVAASTPAAKPAGATVLGRDALLVAAAVTALVIGGGSAVALAVLDDPWVALARLRGEDVVAAPLVWDLGNGQPGESRTYALKLHNFAAQPVRVVGGTTTCACLATADLPITLAPGEARSINIKVKFTGSPGRFQHRFELFTDHARHRVLVARFAGRVQESASIAAQPVTSPPPSSP